MSDSMKIRVCVDQPDPKLAKSKFLGKVLCVPVENLNEKIKFDEVFILLYLLFKKIYNSILFFS